MQKTFCSFGIGGSRSDLRRTTVARTRAAWQLLGQPPMRSYPGNPAHRLRFPSPISRARYAFAAVRIIYDLVLRSHWLYRKRRGKSNTLTSIAPVCKNNSVISADIKISSFTFLTDASFGIKREINRKSWSYPGEKQLLNANKTDLVIVIFRALSKRRGNLVVPEGCGVK